jgi:hypothetical protein
MKIQDASVLMTSTKSFQTRYEEKEHIRAWVDPQDQGLPEDKVTISRPGKSCSAEALSSERDLLTEEHACLRVTLEMLLAEVLSGKEVEMLEMARFERSQKPTEAPIKEGETDNDPLPERVGWGTDYSYQASYKENETIGFFAVGIIRTADGKDVDFALRLDMHREYVARHSLNLRAGDAVLTDPLVINFDGNPAQLGNTTFAFDLDGDGTDENLPTLGPGRGFLAIDLNHDGMITNGKELFGPRTGRGFAELSEYDVDGNHWIDEADPGYDKLSVWTPNDQGNHALSPLKDKGVGAIYLGNLASGFDLKRADNDLKGRITNTGIFLSETGNPGSIQELDLAV